MKSDVAGMSIPDELIKRMVNAEDQQEEGIKIALGLINRIREIPGVRGIHLMPVMWEASVSIISEQAGFLPRPNKIER